MDLRSFSFDVANASTQNVIIPDIPQGSQVISFQLSVEDTVTVKVQGITNLNLLTWDESAVPPVWLQGFELGGDLTLNLSDLIAYARTRPLVVQGGVQINITNNSGASVKVAGIIIFEEALE